MRMKTGPRMRIRIQIKILIRTCGSEAKGSTDIKLQVARLIWPGGMSGAPESAAALRPSIRRSGRADWRGKTISPPLIR